MEPTKDIMKDAAEDELIMTCVFDAPREQVFKAWTEAESMEKWWLVPGAKTTIHAFNAEVGGMFQYFHETAGGIKTWGRFIYQEINSPVQIAFISSFSDETGNITRAPFSNKWPLEVLNKLTLIEQDGKALLTIKINPVNATAEEHMTFGENKHMIRQGLGQVFDHLSEYLASK